MTKPKSRLGRGLSSLISVSVGPPAGVARHDVELVSQGSQVAELRVGTPAESEILVAGIMPNPHQPRRDFDPIKLQQLVESLKSSGVIQPIIVRRLDGGYQLIAGERRLRAAKLAGLATIPAVVRDVDSLTQAQLALVENIQREDLNPLDRATAYRALIDQLGLTQAELASRLGEDRSTIANHLRLLDLAERVQELIRSGRLSLGHAKLLAGVDDVSEQQRLADLVIAQELSVRNLERMMQSPAEPPAVRTGSAVTAHIADLEKTISRQLGMRVQVRRSGGAGRGRLVIHYGSLDQFDQLLGRLNVATE